MGGVGSDSMIRYSDFMMCMLRVMGHLFLRQLRFFIVYSSASDAVNYSRAGRWSLEVHLPSRGVHERGTTLFSRTGGTICWVFREARKVIFDVSTHR